MRIRTVLSCLAVGAGLITAPIVTAPAAHAAPSTSVAASLKALDGLAVKGRAPKTGYDRDLFGQAWSDDVAVAGGHNGCDTRNDVLRRDLSSISVKPGTRGCVVASGTLRDAYTGKTISFVRGSSTSSAVQIDHVVALSDAWQKGAQQWTSAKRRDFANDPLNLRAVDGPANMRKRDGDAATWLPQNRAFRCSYVADQIRVKAKYGVWVTGAEKTAMKTILADCSTVAPALGAPPAPRDDARPAPKPHPRPEPAPQRAAPAPAQTDSVYFTNCSAARAAGAAPLLRGEPGYRPAMDRDGDGVACE